MTKKMHRFIDLCFVLFPFALIFVNVFRNGDLNFTTIESEFAIFRQMDFGLFDYFISNAFPNLTPNAILLLTADVMIYFLYWRLFDLMYCLLGFFVDILKLLADKWGGIDD